MSTFPEPTSNEPENPLTGEDVAPPSTDPLASENIPIPPAEWTGEPESLPQPDELASPVFPAPPTAEEILHPPIFTTQRAPAH